MSVTAADPPPGLAGAQVAWLGWDDYLAWLGGRLTHTATAWGERVKLGPAWAPGQHMALIGPTGDGKTTHAVGVLSLRNNVLALDPKGEDQTLSASGYVRVGSIWRDSLKWRARNYNDARTWDNIWKAIDDGRPARVIVGGPADNPAQFARLRALMEEAVEFARYSGGWTLFGDEFEVLTSPEMFRLRPPTNQMLNTARARAVTIVSAYQAQAWVSKHAIRQARMAVMWQTGSRSMIKAVGEEIGRDWRQLAAAIDQLPPFHTLTVPRGPRDPMVITRAPKLGSPGRPSQPEQRQGSRGAPAGR